MPEADQAILSEYLRTPIRAKQRMQAGNRSVMVMQDVDGWRGTKFDEINSVREQLSPEGQVAFDLAMEHRNKENVLEKGLADVKKSMYNQDYLTITEQNFKQSEDKSVQYISEISSILNEEKGTELEQRSKHLEVQRKSKRRYKQNGTILILTENISIKTYKLQLKT